MLIEDLQMALQLSLKGTSGPYIVAVSGGRDSMALLYAMWQVAQSWGLAFSAATFNHHIRPDADADVAFVQAWCEQRAVACDTGGADVPAMAARQGLNLESAARSARYAFLAEVARQRGSTHIMTAHHADDQAETVIMHLLRGASLAGLAGMRAVSPHESQRNLVVVRPFLRVPRAAIDTYVNQNAIAFVDDPTNTSDTLTRNHIRHHLMPLLTEYNPLVSEALARLSVQVRDDLDIVEAVFAEQVSPHILRTEQGWILNWALFCNLRPALQRRFMYRAHQQLSNTALDFDQVERAVGLLMAGDVRKQSVLPGRIPARIVTLNTERHVVIGMLPHSFCQIPPDTDVELLPDMELVLANLRMTMQTCKPQEAHLHLPADASIRLRVRRSGDMFYAPGLGGRRVKLADWMIDHKIPREVRATIPLVEANGVIAAVLLKDIVVAHPFIAPMEAYNSYKLIVI